MKKGELLVVFWAVLLVAGSMATAVFAGETVADQTAEFEKLKGGFLGKTCEMKWYADGAPGMRGGRETSLTFKELYENESGIFAKIKYKWEGDVSIATGKPESEHTVALKYDGNKWIFEYPSVKGRTLNFYTIVDGKDFGLYGRDRTYSGKATCK